MIPHFEWTGVDARFQMRDGIDPFLFQKILYQGFEVTLQQKLIRENLPRFIVSLIQDEVEIFLEVAPGECKEVDADEPLNAF